MNRLYAALAILVVAGLLIWRMDALAYSRGFAAAEAIHASDIAKERDRVAAAAEQASRKEAERLAVEAERDALARELEDAALQDPDAGRMCLGVDSVRRLQKR